ncbi:MAG TPA: NADH-quinone oxidoreductase subunit J [Acetobacteraceae bacterium]|nr:NADH-quinone oxidoreductase subunit J [Acetobacteraceae bacterium]
MTPGSAENLQWSSPEGVAFLALSFGIVAMALLCMTRKNPVTAVMSLVATFFGLAALYTTLVAHFIAVLQVLVYAGAIMVLFIFVVMIVNREETSLTASRGRITRVVLFVLGGGFGLYEFVRVAIPEGVPAKVAAIPDSFGTVGSIGDVLFRQFLFPFEAISLLLLVAIVGGVVVSRSHRKEAEAAEAAEKRVAISNLATHDFPAPAGEDEHAGDAHAAGGHH